MHGQRWPKERTEKFRALTALGWSAGLIAAELGLTRNAVIGKWHRSGIVHREKPPGIEHLCKQRRSYKRRRPTSKPWPQPSKAWVVQPPLQVVEPPLPVISDHPKRLLDLAPRECRFPISPQCAVNPNYAQWQLLTYLFCGNPIQKGCSYCAGHNWIAHNHEPRKRQRIVMQPLWSAPA